MTYQNFTVVCFNSPSVSADIVVGLLFTSVESVAAVMVIDSPSLADVVAESIVFHDIIVVCSLVGIAVDVGLPDHERIKCIHGCV